MPNSMCLYAQRTSLQRFADRASARFPTMAPFSVSATAVGIILSSPNSKGILHFLATSYTHSTVFVDPVDPHAQGVSGRRAERKTHATSCNCMRFAVARSTTGGPHRGRRPHKDPAAAYSGTERKWMVSSWAMAGDGDCHAKTRVKRKRRARRGGEEG